MLYSSLIAINYYREYNDIILKKLIELNINMNISIFYEKQNKYETIKKLTYHIGNVAADISSASENQVDIDIAAFTYSDAKYIRKELQLGNEDLYYIYMYFTVFSKDYKELEYNLNKVNGILSGIGIYVRNATFRQEQVYLASLPLFINKKEIKEASKRNVLTSSLVATYPFISSSIYDKRGIYYGKNMYDHSNIFINKYLRTRYKNSNIAIFGTSGAGKSFYTKLMIIRNRLLGIDQFVIDPEREYQNLTENLKGIIIKIGPTSNTYINIFDIRENSIEENQGYLASKIRKLLVFFNMIFIDMTKEEEALIEEKIIEVYKLKNITFDDKSLYKNTNKNNGKLIFKESIDMPKLDDLYKLIDKDRRLKNIKIKLMPFIKGSLNYFNNYTNIKINNKLIVADIYELGEENYKYGMYLFIELFWDKIKEKREINKTLYIDEVWRLIGVTANKEVASFVYKIFKTIRKYGGSAVIITQDVNDLFSLDNGTYGKSILNNSSIKLFFSLEEENIILLEKYMKLSDKEKYEIRSLKTGECLIIAGYEHFLLSVDFADFEKKIIGDE